MSTSNNIRIRTIKSNNIDIENQNQNQNQNKNQNQIQIINNETDFKSNKQEKSSIEYWSKEMNINEYNIFWCSLITFLITVIIVTSTVSMSYHYVRYDQYAFRSNKYHGVQLSKVYTEGRYFLTLDNSMIYFPSVYKPIKFVSNTFSENGLEFDLDISFYYKIPNKNLAQIYNLYSTSYENKIESNAKQVTKNIASTFSVEEFLTNRSYIEKTIGLSLEKQIGETLNIYVPNDYFKIISIDFPDILISKSLDTAIALQNNQIASLQQSVNLIKADTNQMISQITAQTNKILEYAQTESSLIESNANSVSNNILLTARTNGMNLFCNQLNISNPEQINKINKIFSIIDNVNNLTLFNTQNNIIVNV